MQRLKELNRIQSASRRSLAWSESSAIRLWLSGLAMLLPALVSAWQYPLATNSGGLTDIGKLSGYRAGPFAQYVVGLAAMFALYLLGLRESRRLAPARALPAIFGCAALLAAAMVVMYPVNAIDLFLYAARSRLLTTYGANPSAVPPRDYPADAWAAFVTPQWAAHTSPYGPLWNLLAAPITALAGDDMLAALLGFKLLMAASLLAGGWAIARALAALGRPQDAPAGALLYLWNPLVLWEGVGNGHNDVLLALLIALALWAWAAGNRTDHRPPTTDHRPMTNGLRFHRSSPAVRRPSSFVRLSSSGLRPLSFILHPSSFIVPLLVVAALVKYVTLPLIPLAAIALWRQAGNGHARLRLAIVSGLLSLAALAIALFPFYDLKAAWASLTEQGSIIYTSPAAAAIALLHQHLDPAALKPWLLLLGGGGALIVWAYQAGALSRRPARLPLACFEALFALLMLATWNLRPWYLIWLVALAALLPWDADEQGARWRVCRAVAWTAGGLAGYAFFIWIEAWWQPGYDLTQIVGVAIMIGPVLLVTLVRRSQESGVRSQNAPGSSDS